ncbi:uncharacterized protein LOC129218052 [Uloborus diversus]|uniref:uncharacterized protein LOC129218052 n=1 Tax=Uloborus diversus TaxID=327109 RepID=UPI002409992C|nr:uncharacterized protein LOC129218052 [Uloborus diversus]
MEQMKTKRFALLLACVLCSTVLVLLFQDPSVQPSIQTLVTQTHTRIANWKTFQVNRNSFTVPDPEEKYLKQLGFQVDKPCLYPKCKWTNVTLPVFVTAVLSNNGHFVFGFLKSFHHFFPDHLVIMYNLGLSPSEYSLVNGLCNSTNCLLRDFDFGPYPSHIKNLELNAYRPIVIQEVLNQAGAVIMMDVQYVFTSGEIHSILKQAEKEGLVSWSIHQPTSALTHPRMFDFFNTRQEKFFFHRMVEPNHIVLYNLQSIHFRVMLPWVKCSLVPNCIAPIGSQNSGCRFDKKPLYRYSGCHRYDTSALNVALGVMFDFSSSHYYAKEEDKFFHLVDVDKEVTNSEKNSTIFPDST